MPPEQLHQTTVGSTTPRPVPSPLIPDHLRPRWRDLPALSWLTVRRLDTKLQAVPVLGRAAAWCAVPLILLTLVCAQADGRLAARHRHAVVWLRPLSATGRGIYTARELLITAVAFLPMVPVLLLAIAIGTATRAGPFARAVALALAAIVGGAPLLAFFAVNRLRDLTTRTRQQHRRIAAQAGEPLVVAQCLVADTSTGAGIMLVRALRAHVDRLGLGVVAVARDEQLLLGYRANGFVQTEPDPASRLLYRPPNANARIRAETSERKAARLGRT